MQITDEKAAELVLGIIPRMQFQGNELEALVALRNWAHAKVETAKEMNGQTPLEDIAAE